MVGSEPAKILRLDLSFLPKNRDRHVWIFDGVKNIIAGYKLFLGELPFAID